MPTRYAKHVRAASLMLGLTISAACGDKGPSAEEQAAAQQAAAQQAAAEAARAEAASLDVAITPRIHFDFDQALIRSDARPILDAKVTALKAGAATRIRLTGHADPRGPTAYNQALGLRRAQAAAQSLVRAGIDAARIETVSRGETQLMNTGTTREAHAQNRRVEFEVVR